MKNSAYIGDHSRALLQRKLAHFGLGGSVDICIRNLANLTKKCHFALRSNQHAIIFNTLATTWRTRYMRAFSPPSVCYLCGSGRDDIRHLFDGDCQTTYVSFHNLSTDLLSVPLQRSKHHAFLTTPLTAKEVLFCVSFNLAIWRTRRICQVDGRTGSVKLLRQTFFAITKSFVPRPSAIKDKTRLRTERKKLNKQRAKDETLAFMKTIPSNSISFSTDGSYIQDSDTSGAGVHAVLDDEIIYSDCLPIKGGSNNIGELAAIWMVFRYLLLVSLALPRPPSKAFIFCDSQYSIGVVSGLMNPRSNRKLINSIKLLASKVVSFIPVDIMYVPSHVGISGNEIADTLASGAARSAASGGGIDIKTLIHDTLD